MAGYEDTSGWPRAETAADYISMGFDEDLEVATTIAIQEMVDFLLSQPEFNRSAWWELL